MTEAEKNIFRHKVFARRLRERREALGYTRKQVVKECEITSSSYSEYEDEQGLRYPTVRKLITLADYLEVGIDHLLGRV